MAPFYHLVRVLIKLIASLVGYLAGLVMGAAGEGVRQPVSSDPRIPRPDWGPDLRMMDDEYL